MFDAIRNNKKIIQFVLALIVLPFAFWGVESYVSNAGGGGEAATVGGSPISVGEFQQALREHQDRIRPALNGQVDPAILDNPQLRTEILERLAQERLFLLYADKSRLMTSNEQLTQLIASEPSLQENGKFSQQRYQALVAAQGMSEATFEARLRKNLTLQQAPMAIGATVSGPAASERWLAGQLEEREIAEVLLRPESHMPAVKITPEAIAAYYETNKKQFEMPEQVRVEYVVLDSSAKVDQAAKYAEIAEGFSNAVYEQSDSLEPAAKKYGLTIKKSDWLIRGVPVDAKSIFSNAKLMAALFSEDAIKNKRNTEAIELPDGIVSARVLEHRPATLQPLATVSATIEKRLARQEAATLALKAGEDNLARLNKGEQTHLVWGTPRTIQRSFAPNLSKEAVRAVFQVTVTKLPAYTGVPLPGSEGYALYRISKATPYVLAGGSESSAAAKALQGQYARLVAEEEFSAWTALLRDRYPVEINKKMLEVGK